MYREDGSEEDFEYLKYYRRRLMEDLEQMFDCHIHIHRGSAYFLSGEECRIGAVFPGNNSLADILLLCFGEIRKKIENKEWNLRQDEMCVVDKVNFEALICKVKKQYGSGFSKLYREMPEGEFVRNVIDEMTRFMFVKSEEDTQQVRVCPLAGKLKGGYPEDYLGGDKDESKMAGK